MQERTVWTPREIAGSYRRSGEKTSQITILAELNGCDKEVIKNILRKQGFTIKEKEKNIMARPKKNTVKEQTSSETLENQALENIAEEGKSETAAAGQKVIPSIVVTVIQQQMDKIMQELNDIEKARADMQKKEDELTSDYSQLKKYLKGAAV